MEGTDWRAEYVSLQKRYDRALLQVHDLQNALDRDKTGLAAALAKVREEVKGRRWICEGRGPYTYDDDRYRQETGFALDAIEKIAADALAASGNLAHQMLIKKRVEPAQMEERCHHTLRWDGGPIYCFRLMPCPDHGVCADQH